MNLTSQQTAFISELRSGNSGIALMAAAGSGKTSTLVEACKHIPHTKRALALAFNRRIKEELSQRLPANVTCLTLNGLGHRAWGRHVSRRCTPDANKLTRMAKDIIPDEDGEIFIEVVKLASRAKAEGLLPSNAPPGKSLMLDDERHWEDIAVAYDIEFSSQIHQLARQLLNVSILASFQGDLDFDDQLYMPVVYSALFDKYDIVMVDEAQDLSPIQHEMLAKSLGPLGRLIAVGDPMQSIYGFRGAMSNSMDALIQRFALQRMPLSVSFRCPKTVVREARELTTAIDPWPDAPDGEVVKTTLGGEDGWPIESIVAGTAIICRTNAPLCSIAYKFVKAGIGVVFIGRDFGKGLVKIVEKIGKDKPAEQIADGIERWRHHEVSLALAKGREAKAESIRDKADSLQALLESGATNGRELIALIQQIFSATAGKVTLSSIHRAKGLEWDEVIFLNYNQVPSERATRNYFNNPELYGDQYQQEINCKYVAITRAKQKLIYATMEKELENA